MKKSKSKSMEEYDRSRLGVCGVPVIRDVYHVLHIPMPVEPDSPTVLQKLMSETVTKGDKDIPKEGTG